jgi:hypothetical protein
MSDDILEQAARALREETAEPDPASRFTRRRVMASLHRRERRRRSRIVWLLPIAAVLAGTTALASAGGGSTWQSVAAAIGIGESPPAEPPKLVRAPLRHASRRVVPAEAPATAPSIEPETPAADKAPPAPRPSASRALAIAQAPEPAPPDPTLPLYREAHRLHFAGGSPSAALAAWDRYLAAAPGGRFAVEARYNRAICLVRLGRRDEAKRELEPFANGTFGAYRQASARSLVESL